MSQHSLIKSIVQWPKNGTWNSASSRDKILKPSGMLVLRVIRYEYSILQLSFYNNWAAEFRFYTIWQEHGM